MQLVYLDEAGIGSIGQEPYLVVAGVLVNPDVKWRSLEKHLSDLTVEYFPEYETIYGKQFVFHAKDIWHGSGDFPRSKWTRTERMKILFKLSQIPKNFDLTIVGSFADRRKFETDFLRDQPGIPKNRILEWTYAYAFLNTARRVEKWMQENAPNEVAMIIAEDTDRVKQLVGAIHSAYTDRSVPISDFTFQSKHIVDSVHFTKKDASVLLQIADHCAFFLKRKMMGCVHSQKFYDVLAPQIFLRSAGTRTLRVRIPPGDYTVIDRSAPRKATTDD